VATDVVGDHLERSGKKVYLVFPVSRAGAQTVDKQDRFTLTGHFVIHVDVVDPFPRHILKLIFNLEYEITNIKGMAYSSYFEAPVGCTSA
jgi:hypothetical protein